MKTENTIENPSETKPQKKTYFAKIKSDTIKIEWDGHSKLGEVLEEGYPISQIPIHWLDSITQEPEAIEPFWLILDTQGIRRGKEGQGTAIGLGAVQSTVYPSLAAAERAIQSQKSIGISKGLIILEAKTSAP